VIDKNTSNESSPFVSSSVLSRTSSVGEVEKNIQKPKLNQNKQVSMEMPMTSKPEEQMPPEIKQLTSITLKSKSVGSRSVDGAELTAYDSHESSREQKAVKAPIVDIKVSVLT
jgi:hypothetical protein